MTRDEWAKFHGFSSDDVMIVDYILKLLNGKITAITNKDVDKCQTPAIIDSRKDKSNGK